MNTLPLRLTLSARGCVHLLLVQLLSCIIKSWLTYKGGTLNGFWTGSGLTPNVACLSGREFESLLMGCCACFVLTGGNGLHSGTTGFFFACLCVAIHQVYKWVPRLRCLIRMVRVQVEMGGLICGESASHMIWVLKIVHWHSCFGDQVQIGPYQVHREIKHIAHRLCWHCTCRSSCSCWRIFAQD